MADTRDLCLGRGVYNPVLGECRCTAGWVGRLCTERRLRKCNVAPGVGGEPGQLCAGNCDEDRGLCYCAGLPKPFQRPLPSRCSPSAHTYLRLPDGRPAFPVRHGNGSWVPFVGGGSGRRAAALRTGGGWYREWAKPWQLVYDAQPGDPAPSQAVLAKWGRALSTPRLRGYCTPSSNATVLLSAFEAARASGRQGARRKHSLASADAASGQIALQCDSSCPEGRRGPFCELGKQAFCLRDCSSHGWCDAGFCWCEPGWFGIDCSQTLGPQSAPLRPDGARAAQAAHSHLTLGERGPPPRAEMATGEHSVGAAAGVSGEGPSPSHPLPSLTPRKQEVQGLPSARIDTLLLRVYIYDLPAEFTT